MLECIRNLMENMGMTVEQAVKALGIPVDEQAGILICCEKGVSEESND